MRINLHDFSGHPFQVELARELARRGHVVDHTFCSQYVTGHGRLYIGPDDPDSLRITPLSADIPMTKYRPVGRLLFERSYARSWQAFLDAREFDVVVSCNVPLVSLALMERYFRRQGMPWVFWHQDIYSRGIRGELERQLPFGATVLGRVFEALEKRQVRNARDVVAIADTFLRQYRRWGLRTDHVTVIPNWAARDDISPGERDNAWSRLFDLPADSLRLLYAGTLGRKHNPQLLVDLLDAVQAEGVQACLIVCSEGVGADDLQAAVGHRPDVRLLGFQPIEQFSDVLASADVLIALLEPDAAEFSVPSKVASYLASGRPTLGFVPGSNPAAADITAAGGLAVEPQRASVGAAARWVAARSGPDGPASGPPPAPRSVGEIVDSFEEIITGRRPRR